LTDRLQEAAGQRHDGLRPIERRRTDLADSYASSSRSRGNRPQEKSTPGALPPEIAFLLSFGVPAALLQYAATLARRQGVSADAALLAEGLVSEDSFYRAFADYVGVDFLDQGLRIVPPADPLIAADQGYVQLAANPSRLKWLFAPSGAAISGLIGAARGNNSRPLFAVTTRTRFLAALSEGPLRAATAAAPYCAERADAALCARRALGRRSIAIGLVANVALFCCLFQPVQALALVAALPLAALFLASVLLRLFACAESFDCEDRVFQASDAELPIYTVIIPLYHEAEVAQQLALAIDRLDYPRAKLDVIFMVEQDDLDTAQALRRHAPRAPHRILIAPDGSPRTKPRAMNIAAPFARGALLTIYDAEDLPEPRQLRRAAALFARRPERVACLQASLCIDNGAQNAIAAHFALEYAALFDVFNRGLSAMNLPMFLGGTSNHFRGIR
ncbi:MAG: glycosyltransferase, partial [Methylocystis sp.]